MKETQCYACDPSVATITDLRTKQSWTFHLKDRSAYKLLRSRLEHLLTVEHDYTLKFAEHPTNPNDPTNDII